MRNKLPTATWSKRNQAQLVEKTPYEIKEAYFGYSTVQLAKSTKAFIFKFMNPSWIPEEDLMSGKSMGDYYFNLLEKILWPAECLTKATLGAIKVPIAGN